MNRMSPITILLTSYNRLNFLKKTIEFINDRTFYPFRIIVIDNASNDGSKEYLKNAKVIGKIWEHLFLPENVGQSSALNAGFKLMQEWEARRPSNDLFITTNEDILAPKLTPCWLERMVYLFQKYEPDGYGGLCMRIERTSRIEIDENKEIMELHKSFPSVFRMLRRSDVVKLGDKPFGELKKWDSHPLADKYREVIKKKYAMATKLYASHIGYMAENKGFPKDVKNFTVAENKLNMHIEKPYPDIDPVTFIPLKANHNSDLQEQRLREEYWSVEIGLQSKRETKLKRHSKNELLKHFKGLVKVADLGCGMDKVNPEFIGVDLYPYECVDIVNNVKDLWFFKDGELDGITASHVLEHIADTKKVLKEWNRVLRRRGVLGIVIPDGDRNRGKAILEPSHKVNINMETLRRLIGGFLDHKLCRLEYISGIPERKKSIICISQKR